MPDDFDVDSRYKVRLISVVDPETRVVFHTTPTFSESGGVDYNQVSPIHMPGSIQVYRRTNPRSFSLTSNIFSRTTTEATDNMNMLQVLRSWRFPYFGASTLFGDKFQRNVLRQQAKNPNSQNEDVGAQFDAFKEATAIARAQAVELRGAPPEVLYLYAYSASVNDNRRAMVNINRIPVVLSDMTVSWPTDVDYLPTTNGKEPFPIRIEVSLTLLETHSPREFERFSLEDYRLGKLVNF